MRVGFNGTALNHLSVFCLHECWFFFVSRIFGIRILRIEERWLVYLNGGTDIKVKEFPEGEESRVSVGNKWS